MRRARLATVLSTFAMFGACRHFDRYVEGRSQAGGAGAADGGDGGEAHAGNGLGGAGHTAVGGGPEGGARGASAGNAGRQGGSGGGGGKGNGVGKGGEGARRDGGQGGAAGEAGEGGAGTGGSDIGGAGAGSGGIGPGESCSNDQAIIPECVGTTFPPLLVERASGIGLNAQPLFGGGFHVFASKGGSHMVGISWTVDTTGHSWMPWRCFDAIPFPERLAGTTLRNGFAEVYLTSRCGTVYVRRLLVEFAGGWSPWMPFALPSPSSLVTDIATSLSADCQPNDEAQDLAPCDPDSARTNHVYVADRGSVFMRHRIGSDSYGPFSSWRDLGSPGALLVGAGLRSDGRQQVLILDREGKPSSSTQVARALGAGFGTWEDFGSPELPELVDIEVPYGTEAFEAYALDADGYLWNRHEDGAGGFTAWEPWQGEQPALFVGLAAAAVMPTTVSGSRLALAAIADNGRVYLAQRVSGYWGAWIAIQSL